MLILILGVAVVTAGVTAYYMYRPNAPRVNKFRQWMRNPADHPDWKLTAALLVLGGLALNTLWPRFGVRPVT